MRRSYSVLISATNVNFILYTLGGRAPGAGGGPWRGRDTLNWMNKKLYAGKEEYIFQNTYLLAIRGTKRELIHAKDVLTTIVRRWCSKDGRSNILLQ